MTTQRIRFFFYLLLLATTSPVAYTATLTTITQVERVILDSEMPPGEDANWQPARLPIIEYPAHYDSMEDYAVNWFRIPTSGLSADSWAHPDIYIWRHNVRAGVYLNNEYLGGTIKSDVPGRINISWNHPLLIDIPPSALTAEYIYIRVDAGPGGTILSPVLLGQRSNLIAMYSKRHFLQVEVSFWLFLLCCLLSALSVWLWIQRRSDQLYLEFGLLAFFSAITTSFFFLDYVPIGVHFWILTQHAASALVLMLVIRFTLDALSIGWSVTKRWLSIGVVSLVLCYGLLPDYYLQPMGYFLSLLLTAANISLGFYVFYLTLRKPNGTRIWFSIAFLGLMLLQLHDIYYAFLSTPDAHIGASNWMQLSSPLLAIVFFAHLIHRFSDALDVSESLNRTLEARIAATTAELKLSYEKNREFELDTRANQERSTIYRALHDDLGSKLISIVHTAENQNQLNLARGALESLRESIYKASHPAQSFHSCLQQIHEEAELRLNSAGKHYAAKLLSEENFQLEPDIAYNLTRIFREAISNILQHSGADQVALSLEQIGDRIEIRLIDNGLGEIDENQISGGIANIKFRADRINALLAWEKILTDDVQTGNCLSITLASASWRTNQSLISD